MIILQSMLDVRFEKAQKQVLYIIGVFFQVIEDCKIDELQGLAEYLIKNRNEYNVG